MNKFCTNILTLSKDGDSACQKLIDALNEKFGTNIKKGLDMNHYLKAFIKHLRLEHEFGRELFKIIQKDNPQYMCAQFFDHKQISYLQIFFLFVRNILSAYVKHKSCTKKC